MEKQIFVEGIGQVRISRGAVRVDLIAQCPGNKLGETQTELVQQMVMTPEGFISTFASLADAVAGMKNDGLIRPARTSGESEDKPAVASVSSPNFGEKN